MKAITCGKYGPPEVLKITQCNKPIPRRDEVLIKIYATSVTNSDIFIRSSNVSPLLMIPFRLMIGITKPRNPIIGEVFSGVIEYAGPEIKRFKVGDNVFGLTGMSLGAYADYKCMTEIDSKKGCLSVMPGNISFEEATSAAYGISILRKREYCTRSKSTRLWSIRDYRNHCSSVCQASWSYCYRGVWLITFGICEIFRSRQSIGLYR